MQVQQTVTNFRDTGEAIVYSLYNALMRFVSFLPALVGAILILIVGWFISGVLANLIERGLKAVGLERAVAHSGIGDFVQKSGTKMTVSGITPSKISASPHSAYLSNRPLGIIHAPHGAAQAETISLQL